ncbi:MAG: hypothetical protein KGJ59_07960 [Bacteroidota bacterium]|nr:hypothetical protein [Bacteroidota bacterium]
MDRQVEETAYGRNGESAKGEIGESYMAQRAKRKKVVRYAREKERSW